MLNPRCAPTPPGSGLAERVAPNMGTVTVSVVARAAAAAAGMADTHTSSRSLADVPVLDFVATVVYNGTTHVTRKAGSLCTGVEPPSTTTIGVGAGEGGLRPPPVPAPAPAAAGGGTSRGRSSTASNCFSFGGWGGLSSAAQVQHRITVEAPGYQSVAVDVHVAKATSTHIVIAMEKSTSGAGQ